MSACSTPAPRYQPSVDNAEAVKRAGGPVALGTFSVQAGAPNASSIGLRGGSMVSPVGADYAAYLADAIRQELELAGKLDPASQVEVGGELLRNEINAGGISTNDGAIEARFIVKRAGVERFNKIKRATSVWDSSLIGAIAIPRATQQYPILVQKLLADLFGDPDFQAALK